MSYCRWSSDGFMCDVYVYEDCYGGWTTHVASRRITERAPDIFVPGASTEELKANLEAHRKHMEAAEFVDIGLPCDGKSYNDSTAGECADRLVRLKAMGYIVLDYAIDALREEQAEPAKSTG